MALLGLFEVFAVPVEGVAGDETGEQVIGAQRSAGSDEEEAECGREEQIALAVNPPPMFLNDILLISTVLFPVCRREYLLA